MRSHLALHIFRRPEGGKQILLELGQLPGALHHLRVDQQRHVAFDVAVLAGVQVEHELRQRAVQARDAAAQHGEARAGQFRTSLAVEPTVARAQFHVVAHRKIERARRAPAVLLDVTRLVRALGHIGSRQIGDAERDFRHLCLDVGQPLLVGLEAIAQAGHLGHQRRGVLAFRLGLPDGLGTRIAQVLQLLCPSLHLLALGFERGEFGGVERKAAPRELRGDGIELRAQLCGIKHGISKAGSAKDAKEGAGFVVASAVPSPLPLSRRERGASLNFNGYQGKLCVLCVLRGQSFVVVPRLSRCGARRRKRSGRSWRPRAYPHDPQGPRRPRRPQGCGRRAHARRHFDFAR